MGVGVEKNGEEGWVGFGERVAGYVEGLSGGEEQEKEEKEVEKVVGHDGGDLVENAVGSVDCAGQVGGLLGLY